MNLHWEEQSRMVDDHEIAVLCFVDESGTTIGEVTSILFSEKPDPRQVVIRQATRRKPLQLQDIALNLGNVFGTTFNGCAFPPGAAPISTGNYLYEWDAVHSVETWWAYWLKDMH